jgi:L-asparaginase
MCNNPLRADFMRKKILMITTGGTIASKDTEGGLTPELSDREMLSFIPGVSDICEVSTRQLFNLDSTNVTPRHWEMLSKAIEEHYDYFDGFVVCHGTDTLAYTASALSYMVQGSPKPIVITGAQRSIDMDITDAKTNLLDSFIYASDSESEDVTIVFNGKVIVGTRAKKVNAKSYNAFESINFPYLAVIQDGRVVRYLNAFNRLSKPKFFHKMDKKVCVLKLTPGMDSDILAFVFEHYDGIVIESFGVGGIPDYLAEEFYHQLERSAKDNKTVVMSTQVANEGSNMTIYEVGKKVKQRFNLMEAYDMTLEATITKLMWLMSNETRSHRLLRDDFYRKINHDILITS